jgi:putative transposase
MNSYPLEKLLKFLEFTRLPLENLMRTEEFKQSEPLEINDYTTYKDTLIKIYRSKLITHTLKFLSVIVEFQLQIKKMISKDKLNIYKNIILPTKLSQILDQVSISKEKVLKPFWTSHIKDLSKKLWLPIKTDCADLDSNSLNTFYNHKAMPKSWFSTKQLLPQKKKWLKTCSKLSPFSVQESMDSVNTTKKSKTIKLYPNSQQKKILKQFVGVYRYYYNKAIEYINHLPREKTYEFIENNKGKYILLDNEYIYVGKLGSYNLKYSLIPKYTTDKKGKTVKINQTSMITIRKDLKKNVPEWAKEIPSHLIDYAIKEASNAFSNSMAKFKKDKKRFNLKYKSKKNSVRETIQIEKCYFSKRENTIFKTFLGKHIKSSESFKNLNKLDATLTYHRRLGTWTLNIPYDKKRKKVNQTDNMCALDPGIRTFMTMYSPTEVVQFGTDASEKMYKISKEMDIIQSSMTNTNHLRKRDLIKALHRKIKKIQNMKNDLHWKTINYMTNKYKKIILPRFETSIMVRNLTHEMSRKMCTFSFYKFKSRFIEKCIDKGVELIIGTEEYTTKTCTNCGNIKNVGNAKIYNCSNCKKEIERDINGARNIYLKHY